MVHGRRLHGGWWEPLQNELKERGFESHAPSLPVDLGCFNLGQLAKVLSSEAKHLRDGPIVAVGHSWGGNPIMREICEEVIALDFIAGVYHPSSVPKLRRNGVPVSRAARSSMSYTLMNRSNELFNNWEMLEYAFFNDARNPEKIKSMVERGEYWFRDHPEIAHEPGIKKQPEIPMRYIKTPEDHIIPPEVQDMMIAAAGIDTVVELPGSGHMPMVTRPEHLADVLTEPWYR